MATLTSRLRRALSLSSFLLTSHSYTLLPSTVATTNSLSSLHTKLVSPPSLQLPFSHRFFHSTRLSLSASRSFNDVDKIDPDTILFEGCDYKHWLIVMDFGKDPQQRPPPEQMVDTYVNTLAKVVGSVEEAKKKMYACSTTTYTGFQAEVDEDTAQKFEGMPGVIFVLPDSYIDPVNKEYGGDKYINGTIIPRPPPVQYGRVKRGRQNDQRPMPNQQGNRPYNQHGSISGEGRSHMPQSGFPESNNFAPNSNYGPPGMPNRTNYSGEVRQGYQGGNSVPSHQGNYNHGYTHQHQMQNLPGDRGSYAPQGQINNGPGEHGYNHPQEQMRNFPGNHGGYTPQGQMQYPNNSRNYGPPPPARGSDGQTRVGSFEQSPGQYGQGPSEPYGHGANTGYGSGQYGQGPNKPYGHGANTGYGPGQYGQGPSEPYGHGASASQMDKRFSQVPDEQNSMSTEHSSYSPAAQTAMNQRRY
ncbi:hypothetical protein BVRB_6g143660 [Beta vulgaris subsp. vulgaris]|nr:hypothetical protein BVRB_6g143660 [Beta vulgaris subsp. vulgaris]